ncbi:MAG: type II toxin-antitoxin system PemK/MazF family toxin [Clostridia bacterium]|nr:type II toxin-antitoxin system PemK/MazF family toxin [Clostridia bacterium]MDD4376183.1 type II toxin-antitoxin system PemK/MazF family toxin [Clostridia bacterium]
MNVKRGEIYYADLSPVIGSEQAGIRPIVIVQNDIGNKFSPTIIGIAITSKQKAKLPTHIEIEGSKYGLDKDSVILAEQIRTLDKSRLKEKVGTIDDNTMEKIQKAIEISFGMRGDLDLEEMYLMGMFD